MKKKITILLLSFIFLASIFSACGKTQKEVVIKIFNLSGETYQFYIEGETPSAENSVEHLAYREITANIFIENNEEIIAVNVAKNDILFFSSFITINKNTNEIKLSFEDGYFSFSN